jgi:hypothetical protein
VNGADGIVREMKLCFLIKFLVPNPKFQGGKPKRFGLKCFEKYNSKITTKHHLTYYHGHNPI